MHPITLAIFIVWVISLTGWIMNIVAIAGSSFDVITGMLVIRIIGVFIAPIGAVLGFI